MNQPPTRQSISQIVQDALARAPRGDPMGAANVVSAALRQHGLTATATLAMGARVQGMAANAVGAGASAEMNYGDSALDELRNYDDSALNSRAP